VAHVGQERALGPRRVFRGVDGRHQLLLDPLAIGDVHHRAQRAHDAPVRRAEGRGRDLGPEAAAVLALEDELVLLGHPLQAEEHVLAVGRPLLRGHEQIRNGTAHHLLRGVPGELRHARVHVDDDIRGVRDDQAFAEGLHRRAKPRLRGPQILLARRPRLHVAEAGHGERRVVLDLHDEDVHREHASVRPSSQPHLRLPARQLGGQDVALGGGPAGAWAGRGQEEGHGMADQIGFAISEQRLGAGIEGEDAAIGAEAHHGVAGRLEERHARLGVAPPRPWGGQSAPPGNAE
jgi:hypothetical protein